MSPTLSNALFVSDLHLMEDRPDCIRAFFQFLKWIPETTDALFILGDFFEYWVGDDIELPYSTEIAQALKTAQSEKQIPIYFIAGNRDFTLGEDFCRNSGMTLIQDRSLFNIAGQSVLLAHGDIYCTDDKQYQRFRKIIRNRWVLKFLLSLSAKRRIKIAQKLRAQSKARYQREQMNIDVAIEAVNKDARYYQINMIVHGHTHLADIHLEQTSTDVIYQRMVLGDWHQVGWYGRITSEGPQLHQFSVQEPVFD